MNKCSFCMFRKQIVRLKKFCFVVIVVLFVIVLRFVLVSWIIIWDTILLSARNAFHSL